MTPAGHFFLEETKQLAGDNHTEDLNSFMLI